MASRIVENTGKVEIKMGDVVHWDTLYVLCTDLGTRGDKFSGTVIHAEKVYKPGHHSDCWCVEDFKKVSVTIEFT